VVVVAVEEVAAKDLLRPLAQLTVEVVVAQGPPPNGERYSSM
jgi:hypothetical protein